MNPAISIIVPVYNLEQYIKKCLDSILSQTFKDFEVIIVNDGSIDNSGSICNEIAYLDNRVRVIHKKNGGLSSARNAGIKIAKGDFLGFVDSDDYIDKDMYRVLYNLCKETNSDISICKFSREVKGKLINEQNEECKLEMDHDEAMRQLFKGVLYRFSVCNKLFKKTCFENIQFPEGRIHEDLATTYKLFSNARKSVYTNYEGYVYVKREESILTSKFHGKRMDALLGWSEILSFMGRNYPHLSKEFISCFAYGCVDIIHYILNQVENRDLRKEYLSIIQQLVRKFYIKLMLNNTLSLKYKLTITLLQCSTSLLVFSSKSKKILRLGIS
ncbi:glycosyltransferase family 2 protein [Neobacillus sp. NPDC097160]|uniref:glycosyltransferase family 2 protein n=1 Tax=Neobacillus sp. NPDC097160 TaxID=3364298 RepID=UPI003811DD1C